MTLFREKYAADERFTIRSLQGLIDSAEQLMEEIKDQHEPAIAEVRSRASATLKAARARLSLLQPEIAPFRRKALRATGRFVRRDPWRATAVTSLFVLAAIAALSWYGSAGPDPDEE